MQSFKLNEHRGTSIIHFRKSNNLIIGTREGKLLELNTSNGSIGVHHTTLDSVECLTICEKSFIWAGGSNGICQYNQSFNLVREYKYSEEAVIGLAVHNQSLISASEDSAIRVSNENRSEVLYSHQGPIIAFDFLAKSEMIVSCCSDSSLILCSLNVKKPTQIIVNEKIWSLKFMNNGNFILAGDHSGNIIKFNLSTLTEDSRLKSHHDSRVKAITLLNSDDYIATCSFDQTVKIIDLNQDLVVENFTGHSDWVRAITYDSDSSKIFSVADDNSVGVIEFKDLKNHGPKPPNRETSKLKIPWMILFIIGLVFGLFLFVSGTGTSQKDETEMQVNNSSVTEEIAGNESSENSSCSGTEHVIHEQSNEVPNNNKTESIEAECANKNVQKLQDETMTQVNDPSITEEITGNELSENSSCSGTEHVIHEQSNEVPNNNKTESIEAECANKNVQKLQDETMTQVNDPSVTEEISGNELSESSSFSGSEYDIHEQSNEVPNNNKIEPTEAELGNKNDQKLQDEIFVQVNNSSDTEEETSNSLSEDKNCSDTEKI